MPTLTPRVFPPSSRTARSSASRRGKTWPRSWPSSRKILKSCRSKQGMQALTPILQR
ncbi:unnamed protein product [Symbiodinium necroappetens]|uniref:Uncharacterized protein n=1 Tax=Symbiodinium necroappetens TaxID=1628268 RepID=A0A812PMR2_9DINO|nr:unnamed protein product [Symbiodinium necroappetens]